MSSTVDVDFDSLDENKETKHAWFIVFCSDFDTYVAEYVPKSQVEVDEKRKIVTMPVLMAKEKDLI
jgi:hypothetical protein